MRKVVPAAFMLAACFALRTHVAVAQPATAPNGDQLRLECTGTYHAAQGTAIPPVTRILSTFVIDLGKKTVTDAGTNVDATEVHIDATSIAFQNATGGIDHLSRLDGSWTVSGTDGAVAGTCRQVVNKNAF